MRARPRGTDELALRGARRGHGIARAQGGRRGRACRSLLDGGGCGGRGGRGPNRRRGRRNGRVRRCRVARVSCGIAGGRQVTVVGGSGNSARIRHGRRGAVGGRAVGGRAVGRRGVGRRGVGGRAVARGRAAQGGAFERRAHLVAGGGGERRARDEKRRERDGDDDAATPRARPRARARRGRSSLFAVALLVPLVPGSPVTQPADQRVPSWHCLRSVGRAPRPPLRRGFL